MDRGADLLELAEPIERRLDGTLGALERGTLRREHVVDRGLDVLGPQRFELRESAWREQRVTVLKSVRVLMRGGGAVGSIVHGRTLTRRTARKLM